MTTVTAITSGGWTYAGNWSTGATPTINDDVVIPDGKVMVVDYENNFKTLELSGGLDIRAALNVGAGGHIYIKSTGKLYNAGAPTQHVIKGASSSSKWYMKMDRVTPDPRLLDFGSLRFTNMLPSISCVGSTTYPETGTLYFNDDAHPDYWLQANPFPSVRASCSDRNNKGVGKNYGNWQNGQPRSWSVIAKFPKVCDGGSAPYTYDYAEMIRRMAQSPYPVLVSLPFHAFKGQIENVAWAESAKHHKATISLVEAMV